MQLSSQEISKAWWSGATSGAFSGVPKGLLIGLGAAALLFFAAVPAAAALGVSLGPIVGLITTASGAFNPLPLMLLNVAMIGITGAVCGGNLAVKEYHQKKHNDIYEARITALEQIVPTVAQDVEQPQPSKKIQQIIEKGPRHQHSHADAEEQRAADADTKGHTVH